MIIPILQMRKIEDQEIKSLVQVQAAQCRKSIIQTQATPIPKPTHQTHPQTQGARTAELQTHGSDLVYLHTRVCVRGTIFIPKEQKSYKMEIIFYTICVESYHQRNYFCVFLQV